ncbi:MAG: DUF4244 domain-containing protein [Mycobacteriaceae bacterium]
MNNNMNNNIDNNTKDPDVTWEEDWDTDWDVSELDDAVDTGTGDEHGGVLESVLRDDRGMSTIEYALGCVAAAALGALLYLVVTSDAVESALTSIFQRALDTE